MDMPSMMEIHDSLVIHSACRADVNPGMSWHVNKVSMQLSQELQACLKHHETTFLKTIE